MAILKWSWLVEVFFGIKEQMLNSLTTAEGINKIFRERNKILDGFLEDFWRTKFTTDISKSFFKEKKEILDRASFYRKLYHSLLL